MQMSKMCETCGGQFAARAKSAKYCCKKCYREGKRKQAQERYAVKAAEKAEKKAAEAKKKPLWQLNEEARKLGLSYGQYQVKRMMECEGRK